MARLTEKQKQLSLKTYAGLTKAAGGFTPFKLVAVKRDAQVVGTYLFLIKFEDETFGLCIYNTVTQNFVEEPGTLDDYSTTILKVCAKYGFDVPPSQK